MILWISSEQIKNHNWSFSEIIPTWDNFEIDILDNVCLSQPRNFLPANQVSIEMFKFTVVSWHSYSCKGCPQKTPFLDCWNWETRFEGTWPSSASWLLLKGHVHCPLKPGFSIPAIQKGRFLGHPVHHDNVQHASYGKAQPSAHLHLLPTQKALGSSTLQRCALYVAL